MIHKAKEPEPSKEAEKAPEAKPSGGKTWQEERWEQSYGDSQKAAVKAEKEAASDKANTS